VRVRVLIALIIAASGLTFAGAVSAAPVVVIDADPNAEGIQVEIEVISGDMVAIDIWIMGVDPDPELGLHGFQLDLAFDDVILTAPILEPGDFLGDEVEDFCEFVPVADGIVCVAYTRVDDSSSTGSGIIASVIFEAAGVGTAVLSLQQVILTSPFGIEIIEFTTQSATIIVPEPGAALLGLAAMLSLGCLVWFRRNLREDGLIVD
jgi:hypothetical protein